MANTGLDAALGYLARTLSTLPGIKAAPKYATDKPLDLPTIWICPGAGVWEGGPAGVVKGLLSVDIELHLQKRELPLSEEEAMKYAETIPRKIFEDPTLGGTVSTFGTVTVTRLQMMNFGGVLTVGFRYTVTDIKIQD